MMPLRPEPSAKAIDRALIAFWAGSIDEFCRLLLEHEDGRGDLAVNRQLLTALQWHARRHAGQTVRQNAGCGEDAGTDRMYNVRAIMDRNGGIVERYAYDPYGLPLIRESAGRGDMNNDTVIDTGADQTRFTAALYPGPTVEDWRSDINDDGNRDSSDAAPWAAKEAIWDELTPTVAQAYSDIDNPFMFQGTRHFAIDTNWSDTTAKLPLNHHRARFADPIEGRWITRDPLFISGPIVSTPQSKTSPQSRSGAVDSVLFEAFASSPQRLFDPTGLNVLGPACWTDVLMRPNGLDMDVGVRFQHCPAYLQRMSIWGSVCNNCDPSHPQRQSFALTVWEVHRPQNIGALDMQGIPRSGVSGEIAQQVQTWCIDLATYNQIRRSRPSGTGDCAFVDPYSGACIDRIDVGVDPIDQMVQTFNYTRRSAHRSWETCSYSCMTNCNFDHQTWSGENCTGGFSAWHRFDECPPPPHQDSAIILW